MRDIWDRINTDHIQFLIKNKVDRKELFLRLVDFNFNFKIMFLVHRLAHFFLALYFLVVKLQVTLGKISNTRHL